ncbi:eukaryotic mitochondrial regulator protein-domain-containing protein [Podospora appendiculata]|uniref:Eukaryotic mitochondrial regulator protein-domain-containing protein n=1 Tax=Podospora appendiculata TaxID=314037 RepID=A0AAE0XLH4_9PEZI|nr:eukaryotic mitochondrial regulator protein-domain-containing protein [Podospora appendiculata]
MPPRIRSSQVLHRAESSLLQCINPTAPAAGRPSSTPSCSPSILLSSSTSPRQPSSQCCAFQRPQQTSSFSSTASRDLNKAQRNFWGWMRSYGRKHRDPTGRTNYLGGGSNPFPNNKEFKSQPVLSEAARSVIYDAVMKEGLPLKAVSAKYNVDMRRVAAVVRMKEIEKKWVKEGKPLARPYAKAVQTMLPYSNLTGEESEPFEPINDIHVHSYTMQQLFLPTSESRHFTRQDAAKAFGEHILAPDEKMRIPELIAFEKDVVAGVANEDAEANFFKATAASERAIADKHLALAQRDENNKTRVDSGRFEFRFERISVDSAGHDGRARRGVGWRYGVPFNDRRRAVVKIPTKVE